MGPQRQRTPYLHPNCTVNIRAIVARIQVVMNIGVTNGTWRTLTSVNLNHAQPSIVRDSHWLPYGRETPDKQEDMSKHR